MNYFKSFVLFFAGFLFVITSCSEGDESKVSAEAGKTTLSFGAIVNDLLEGKQAMTDLPQCAEDEPSYVQVILAQGENEIVGSADDPFRIDLVPGQIFTEEVPELELIPGTYTLAHFAVYNAGGEIIWLAPRGGVLAGAIDNPLPLSIEINAGVKKYVDVPVLCFDDRNVNEYGYLFFDLNPSEALEFCFFANYCDDDGRHYPAAFSVDIWIGTDNTGRALYSGSDPEMQNSVSTEGEDPTAEPVFVALPNLPWFADYENFIYYEVTLLDWEGVYGDVENTVISGTLNRNDIMSNFDGENNIDYEHFRFGCGANEDADQDGIPDAEDNCINTSNPQQTDTDEDGIGDICDNCPSIYNPPQEDYDADGTGDLCDADADSDGVPNDIDQCPATPEGAVVSEIGCSLGTCVRYPPVPEKCFQVYVEMTITTHGSHDIIYQNEVVGSLYFDLFGINITENDDDLAILIGAGENTEIRDAEIVLPEYDNSRCIRFGSFEFHTVIYEEPDFPFITEIELPTTLIFRANICNI